MNTVRRKYHMHQSSFDTKNLSAARPSLFSCSLLPAMLYLIGLGLADETDITVKGLEIVKKADRVYLEAYTSILLVDKEKLVRFLAVDVCAR